MPKNQITVVENESTIKETPVEIKEILQKTTEEILVQPGEKVGFKQISTTKEIEHEDFAMLRVPLEIPDRMSRLSASLPTPLPEFSLAKMNLITTESSSPFQEERLLADIVKEKTGLDNFKFNQITKAGLNLVSTISKDKFNYETNEEGKVTELNLDTRLLAFSIPTKNEVAGD